MGQAMSALTGVRAPAGGEHAVSGRSTTAATSTSAGLSRHGAQAHDGQIGSRSGGVFELNDMATIPPRASLGDLPTEVLGRIVDNPDLKPRDLEALASTSKDIRNKVLSDGGKGQYLQDLKKAISSVQNADDFRRVLGSKLGVAPLLSIESAPTAWGKDLVGLLGKPLVFMNGKNYRRSKDDFFKSNFENLSVLKKVLHEAELKAIRLDYLSRPQDAWPYYTPRMPAMPIIPVMPQRNLSTAQKISLTLFALNAIFTPAAVYENTINGGPLIDSVRHSVLGLYVATITMLRVLGD
jgi:hypothetical protein